MPASYPENPVSIGDHIRKKRMELKLLQKDVAKICGVTVDCITNWEKNRSLPQIQFYPSIIKFLGYFPFTVDTSTLVGKLKAYRYLNGLSHNRMGRLMEVDGSTICSWENEENNPPQKKVMKLDLLLEKIDVFKLVSYST
jgi:DNA-binding XRE family transcriptional regulator